MSRWRERSLVSTRVPATHRAALDVAVPAWTDAMGNRLVSLVLFGSVARGEARGDSDIDLLVIAEGFPHSLRERRGPLLDVWSCLRAMRDLEPVEWNLVTKSVEEARHHSPLYLDMVEDAILLHDREGFFDAVLAAMQSRMSELGSRRLFLPDGSWYWDLKPDFRWGDVVNI